MFDIGLDSEVAIETSGAFRIMMRPASSPIGASKRVYPRIEISEIKRVGSFEKTLWPTTVTFCQMVPPKVLASENRS